MKEILFFKPVFKEKVWGGQKLKAEFNFNIPSNRTGECWLISGHIEGSTEVKNGTFKGETLQSLMKNSKEVLGGINGDEFPLLIKIIDACDDLSVQVHPNNDDASKISPNLYGKSECWYVLDCDEEAEIVYGHKALTKDELSEKVYSGKWNELLCKKPIQKGDFIYVPAGTVHALKKGTLVLEIQQSSDITYRLYDYDRLEKGKARELHLVESIKVISVPHREAIAKTEIVKEDTATKIVLAETQDFSVYKYIIEGEAKLYQDKPFLIVGVVEGEGTVDHQSIRKGDHFLLPYGYGDFILRGHMTVIASTKVNNPNF